MCFREIHAQDVRSNPDKKGKFFDPGLLSMTTADKRRTDVGMRCLHGDRLHG